MITAVAEATVPKFSVIVRKAYGAGLYAMCGPAFDPDACLALPTAQIAVMGPDPAVNAVFYNRIHAIEDDDERKRVRRRAARASTKKTSTSCTSRPSSSSTPIVQPEDLRDELTRPARGRGRTRPRRRGQAPRRPAGVARALVCQLQQVPDAVDGAPGRHVPEVRPDRRARPDPRHDPPRRRTRRPRCRGT